MIYLDYCARTPLAPVAFDAMSPWMQGDLSVSNASSSHAFGEQAARAIEASRQQIAHAVGAQSEGVVFTSGATEANNLALRGAMHAFKRQGSHMVTVATEHPAVLNVVHALKKEEFDSTVLGVDRRGGIDLQVLSDAIRPDTTLISVMAVNNETGYCHDLAAIAEVARDKGVLFHVDAAQAIGKIAVDMKATGIDLLSLSSHKCYGPQGVGALVMRTDPKINIQPQMAGGGQEGGLRSGSESVPLIVGMGAAYAWIDRHSDEHETKMRLLRRVMEDALHEWGGFEAYHDPSHGVPHILNGRFKGVRGESLRACLQNTVAVSSGSACAAASSTPSHVLTAMGIEAAHADDALRVSLGFMTTLEDVQHALTEMHHHVGRLRHLAWPWYDG